MCVRLSGRAREMPALTSPPCVQGNDSPPLADGSHASRVAAWITLRIFFPANCVRTYREGLSAKRWSRLFLVLAWRRCASRGLLVHGFEAQTREIQQSSFYGAAILQGQALYGGSKRGGKFQSMQD